MALTIMSSSPVMTLSVLNIAQQSSVQVNLIITLSFGSMKTDHVISESCNNEVIYNRHIAK